MSRSALSSIREFAKAMKETESRAAHTPEIAPQPSIAFAGERRDDVIPILS
jgi:hypothetical protein